MNDKPNHNDNQIPKDQRNDLFADATDTQMETLFASLKSDTAPLSISEHFQQQLERQSRKVFSSAIADRAPTESPEPDSSFNQQPGDRPVPTQRKRPMFTLAVRGLVAAASLAMMIGSGYWMTLVPGDAASTLEASIAQVADANTVELTVARSGQISKVYAKRPQQLRWETSNAVYRIAHGQKLWNVDETANRVTAARSTFFSSKTKGVDLFQLLPNVTPPSSDVLKNAKPSRQIDHAGRKCDLYQLGLLSADNQPDPQIMEVVVDARSKKLRWIETKVRQNNRWKPLSKITLVSMNKPVEDAKFVVGNTLTEDGRIGKVIEAQGIVSIKAKMGRRFRPVADNQQLLRPGDWIRTDMRGANAVKLRLVKETSVTLGPGTLVELISPRAVRVQSGTVKIVTDKKNRVEVTGPNGTRQLVDGKLLARADSKTEQLITLKQTPRWLASFEGSSADHSIGSLIVNVDGRNLPLTVGYHKVTVDIRDQIARTVIEESFVNRTDSRLEGTFYFPLPQDASISGFGMWIGDELVEADIVEKQRAREIYETILREKRDPGLLEWTGGNIFKARVFPIFAHSEKRVTITYTQVLPRVGNQYRYSYALQSEMLKQHPLRELAVDVRLSSTLPLAKVTSPTHSTARTEMTPHSARVEFTAQEYTPTRDLDVVVEIDRNAPEVTLIPHRRGDDGYFMALVAPPARKRDKAQPERSSRRIRQCEF